MVDNVLTGEENRLVLGEKSFFFSYSNSGSVAQQLTVFKLMHVHWGERGLSDGSDMIVVELQIRSYCGCHGDVRRLSGC